MDKELIERLTEEVSCLRAVLERTLRVMDEGLFLDYQMEKWGKLIKDPERLREDLKKAMFMPDGKTPRCARCGNPMEQVSKYEWKLKCKCIERFPSLKNLRLSMG